MLNRNKMLAAVLLSASLAAIAGCADNDLLQGTRRRDVPVGEVPQDVRELFARRGATIDQVEEHYHSAHNKYYVIHYTAQDGQQKMLRYNVND